MCGMSATLGWSCGNSTLSVGSDGRGVAKNLAALEAWAAQIKDLLNECNQVLFVLLTLLRPPMSLVFKLISFGILIHLLASYPFVGLVFLAIDHG